MSVANCLLAMAAAMAGGSGAVAAEAGPVPPTPPQLWVDYDPDAGDFEEEVVREQK